MMGLYNDVAVGTAQSGDQLIIAHILINDDFNCPAFLVDFNVVDTVAGI